jgi:hypothetical protein
MIGRRIDITSAKVETVRDPKGFFVRAGDTTLFVMPDKNGEQTVKTGDTVGIQGVLLELPHDLMATIDTPAGARGEVYVFATSVNEETR